MQQYTTMLTSSHTKASTIAIQYSSQTPYILEFMSCQHAYRPTFFNNMHYSFASQRWVFCVNVNGVYHVHRLNDDHFLFLHVIIILFHNSAISRAHAPKKKTIRKNNRPVQLFIFSILKLFQTSRFLMLEGLPAPTCLGGITTSMGRITSSDLPGRNNHLHGTSKYTNAEETSLGLNHC